MPDMLVKLYDLPDEAPALARSRAFVVEIRRAMPPDRERVLRWVGEHSGECAAGECAVAFAHTHCGCWIATRGAEIVGYACYDATAPDFSARHAFWTASRDTAWEPRCCCAA